MLHKSTGYGDQTIDKVKAQQTKALTDIYAQPRRIDVNSGHLPSAAYKVLWSLYLMHPRKRQDGTVNYGKVKIEISCSSVENQIRDILMEKDVDELWGHLLEYIGIQRRIARPSLRGFRAKANFARWAGWGGEISHSH